MPLIRLAFEHPANVAVLRLLSRWFDDAYPGNRSAAPEMCDLHRNGPGTHPDVADRMWKDLTAGN